ncbi:MAG: hypothetical protein HC913_07190 [Microscillaceae bacterium]|nr:hypothetical protein [Microscillaceae bacterium]
MGPHWDPEKAELSIRKTGWFTEVRNAISLKLPANLGKAIDFQTQKGKVFFTLPADSSSLQLRLVVAQGDCQVKIPASADFYLQYEASSLQSKLSPKFTQAGWRIFSRPQARLRLQILLKKVLFSWNKSLPLDPAPVFGRKKPNIVPGCLV